MGMGGEDLEIDYLKEIIEEQNDDIIALKLLQFEATIELNRRNEEIEKLQRIISDLLFK